jgi:hypothetical protein
LSYLAELYMSWVVLLKLLKVLFVVVLVVVAYAGVVHLTAMADGALAGFWADVHWALHW